MDWNDIQVFRAVARARSLTQGARQLGLDRSTASRRIAALEKALVARLFLRTRAGLKLSASGERLLAHAERMGLEAHALERSASEEGQGVAGLVRIATTDILAELLVRGGLLALRATHPALELEILGGNRPVDLSQGEADLALRLTRAKEPSLRVRRVARFPFAVFAGEKYLAQRGRPRTPEELAGHDVLVLAGELASLPEAKWLAARPGVRVALRTNSLTTLLAGVTEGYGLALLSAPRGVSEPKLVRLFEVSEFTPRGVWLVMHPDAAARTAVRVVAEHVASVVGQGA